ncbi:uncharacterized protein LOC144466883 [Epinephelus lanceolatus]
MAEKQYKMTDEEIYRLIDLRVEHEQLFTGGRGTAKKAWRSRHRRRRRRRVHSLAQVAAPPHRGMMGHPPLPVPHPRDSGPPEGQCWRSSRTRLPRMTSVLKT